MRAVLVFQRYERDRPVVRRPVAALGIERLHVPPLPVVLHDERQGALAFADHRALREQPAARQPVHEVPDAGVEVLVPENEDLPLDGMPVEIGAPDAVRTELRARNEAIVRGNAMASLAAVFHRDHLSGWVAPAGQGGRSASLRSTTRPPPRLPPADERCWR